MRFGDFLGVWKIGILWAALLSLGVVLSRPLLLRRAWPFGRREAGR